MENKLNFIEKLVSTLQYNDYKGIVTIDQHHDAGIFRPREGMCELAAAWDIDTNKYSVYSLVFSDQNDPIGSGDLTVTFLLIDKEKYNGRDVCLEKRTVQMPYSDLPVYIKRLKIGFVSDEYPIFDVDKVKIIENV